MYYPCSENKGADQFRGYRKADLRLCFRIVKNPVFSCRGSFNVTKTTIKSNGHHSLYVALNGFLSFYRY